MEEEEKEKGEGEEEITREPSTVVSVDLPWLIRVSPDLATDVLITLSTRRIRKMCAFSNEIKSFCDEKLDKYFWLAMWESDTRTLKERRIANYAAPGERNPKFRSTSNLLTVVELLAKTIYENPTRAPDWITGGLEFRKTKQDVNWATHPRIWIRKRTGTATTYSEEDWLEDSTTLQAFARFDALLAEPRFVTLILGDRLALLVDRKGGFWEKGDPDDPNDADNYLTEPKFESVTQRFARLVRDAFPREPGPAEKILKISDTEEMRIGGGGGGGEEEEEDVVLRFLMNGEYRWARATPKEIPTAPWAVAVEMETGISWLSGIQAKHSEPGDSVLIDADREGIASDVFYFVGFPQEFLGPRQLIEEIVGTDLATNLNARGFEFSEGNTIMPVLFESALPNPQEIDDVTTNALKRYRLMMIVPGSEPGRISEKPLIDKRSFDILYDTASVGSRLVSGKELAGEDLAYAYNHRRPIYLDPDPVGEGQGEGELVPRDGESIFVSCTKIMKSETGNVFVYFYVFLHYVVVNKMPDRIGYRFVNAQAEPFRLKFSNRDFVDRIYTEDFEAEHVINPKDRKETWERFKKPSRKSSATGRVPSLSDITRAVGRIETNDIKRI